MNINAMIKNIRIYYTEGSSKEKSGNIPLLFPLMLPGPSVRLATTTEIETSPEVQDLVNQHAKGTWIAYAPTKPLAPSASIRVEFPESMSEEGPLTGTKHTCRFHTAAAFNATSKI